MLPSDRQGVLMHSLVFLAHRLLCLGRHCRSSGELFHLLLRMRLGDWMRDGGRPTLAVASACLVDCGMLESGRL